MKLKQLLMTRGYKFAHQTGNDQLMTADLVAVKSAQITVNNKLLYSLCFTYQTRPAVR